MNNTHGGVLLLVKLQTEFHGGVLLLVKLQAEAKSGVHRRCFSRCLNSTSGAKLGKASQISSFSNLLGMITNKIYRSDSVSKLRSV